jgi:hypothetical protein
VSASALLVLVQRSSDACVSGAADTESGTVSAGDLGSHFAYETRRVDPPNTSTAGLSSSDG